MFLWAIDIFPRSVHLFRSQKHECRNWEQDCAVSFLRIFVYNFWHSVFAVWLHTTVYIESDITKLQWFIAVRVLKYKKTTFPGLPFCASFPFMNACVWSGTQSTHRVAKATFCRTFHHKGKISLGWYRWGMHAHPLSLYLPSRSKL